MKYSTMYRVLTTAWLIICLTITSHAQAQLVITKGPYLQNATTNSMVVMWETSAPSDSRVDVGLTSSYTHYAYDPVLTQSHEVTLNSLSPDMLYHYKATSHTATETLVSDDNTFQTAPMFDTPFRFVVYGDSRSQPSVHASVVQGIIGSAPQMVLHTGDYTSNGTNADYWQSDFFDPAAPLIKHTPFFPALGNHENNALLYYQYFSPPAGGGDYNERWYSFDYGNAHFIVLDTDTSYTPGSAQYLWLENELSTTIAEWLFVIHHHPPYSSGNHGSDANVQAYLVPLYQTYGVDMVFTGHDHLYERSLKQGIYYIVTGGGGGPLSTPNTNANPYQQYVAQAYHYCTVDIDSATAILEAHYPDGGVFDSVILSHDLSPTASFTATPISGTAPLLVNFTDTSTGNPTSWSWNFGDNTTSTAQHPTHQYAEGIYTVSLTATNWAGSDSETKTNYIMVTAPITYSLSIDVTGSGSVNVTPTPGPYPYGTTVALQATPATGWRFTGWIGSVTNPNAASTTVLMDADKNITANFSPTGLPKAPSKLVLSALNTSQISLTWQDKSTNENGFKIECKAGREAWSQITSVGVNTTSYIASGLLAGTKYSFRVCAYNDIGNSQYSKSAKKKTFAVMNPTNLTAIAISSSQIDLAWVDNSSNESGFKIQRRKGTSTKWSTIKKLGANLTSYSDTGLRALTQYHYRVYAYQSKNKSAYSNEADAETF